MEIVSAAAGHHRDDPCLLLLLGADGRHYAQLLPDGDPVPIEPDGDGWFVDERVLTSEEVAE
jgi:hypothetical protein